MSHFVTIATQIREKALLEQTLQDLNLRYQSANANTLTVRGYSGNRERAEVVVDTRSQYDIGFQRQGEVYQIIADWWGVQKDTALRQDSFVQDLSQRYNYNILRDQAEREGLVWEDEKRLENGDLVIILSERG